MSARIISFVMEKGGVGKTTSAVNVAAVLGRNGKRVLLIDSDPQGNATRSCYSEEVDYTLYDCIATPQPIETCLLSTDHGFSLAPANGDLSVLEMKEANYYELRCLFDPIREDYDFILIDLPPSLSILTLNGLVASTDIMIPVQPEILAADGVNSLMTTIELFKRTYNPDLNIAGVFMTMYQDNRKLHRMVRKQVQEHFDSLGIHVCSTVIKRSVRFAEAPLINTPAVLEFKNDHAVQAYERLVREVFGV